MSKQIKLFIIVISLVAISAIFTNNALAKEGDCHFDNCFVPAPTVLFPQNNSLVWQKRPVISGLTWKSTIVEVYLDDQLLPNIRQDIHQDYFASFYVIPTFDLKPGTHTIYAYAKSGNGQWYDWSKESKNVVFSSKFTVKSVTLSSGVEAVIPKAEEEKESPKVGKLDQVMQEYFNNNDSVVDNASTTSGTSTAVVEKNVFADDSSLIGKSSTSTSLEVVEPENPRNLGANVEPGQIAGGVVAENNQPAKPNELQPAADSKDLKDILDPLVREERFNDQQKNNVRIGIWILLLLIVGGGVWFYLRRDKDDQDIAKSGEIPPEPVVEAPVVEATQPEEIKEVTTPEPEIVVENPQPPVDNNEQVK